MDLFWIYDIPTWQVGVGITLIFLTISFAGLVTSRPVIEKYFRPLQKDDQPVSAIFSAIGTLYGLLLALVAVATWQDYDEMHSVVDQESASLIQLYRCVSVLNDPSHEAILDDIKTYTKDIIEVEWPDQKHGVVAPSGNALITALHQKIARYESKATTQPIIYTEAVTAFSAMIELRRMRINASNLGIPKVFWLVIVGGAFLGIPILFFFNFPSFRVHLLFTAGYVVYLAGNVAIIAVLDNPLRGEISVSSDPFKTALSVMSSISSQQP